ncbi:hybrid sensor histidine kinase/response regulator, partial [Rhizobium ruizarguesonis]
IIVGLMEMIIIAHERQSRLRSELNSFNTRLEETVVQRTAELRHEMEENAAAQAPLGEIEVADDDRQHVVEIMGDAAGQLADRLHLLQLTDLRLSS